MRYTPETVLSYLEDRRDRVLLMQNPALPMPRFGSLPPLEVGERRYVIARDGLYVQARTLALKVCVALACTPPLPFGSLAASVELVGGLLPRAFFERMCIEALAESPNEWAALVHWDAERQRYEWTETQCLHRSTTRMAYDSAAREESRLVLDVHCHGAAPPFFSSTDDASDRYGVYFASVLGYCDSPQRIRVSTRLVIDDVRIALTWHPWEDLPPCVADRADAAILDCEPSQERTS